MEKIKLFAGPCVVESLAVTSSIAQFLKETTQKFPQIDFTFKASIVKANRTSRTSFTGVGRDYGLEILTAIRNEIKVPVLTDVHSVEDVLIVSPKVDILQIPAMLMRQTDIIEAAARSRLPINIKKSQQAAPRDMKHVIDKIRALSDAHLYVTERGYAFGYNDLIVDFRNFHYMRDMGAQIIFDASHSLQRPSAPADPFARDIAPKMARAAMAFGVDGIFLECHHNPEKARCDGETSLYLSQIEKLLQDLTTIKNIG